MIRSDCTLILEFFTRQGPVEREQFTPPGYGETFVLLKNIAR